MTRLGERLLKSAEEALAIAEGAAEPAARFDFDPVDVAAIRKGLGLSQEKFAQRFGLSPATVRDWEQGRRRPDRIARNLLRVIEYAPETAERAIGSRS